MTNSVRNSDRPMITWLGGADCVPSAWRISDSTMTMRVLAKGLGVGPGGLGIALALDLLGITVGIGDGDLALAIGLGADLLAFGGAGGAQLVGHALALGFHA